MRLIKVFLVSAVLASGSVLAEGHGKGHHGGKHGHGMSHRHANPMPNLMKVIKKHGDQLNLSAEQSAAFADWREKHHKPMHAAMDQVRSMESELNQAALAGKPKAELMMLASQIMNLRTDIVATKADCRDNMRSMLSAEQYDKVLTIYADMAKK